MRSAVGSDFFFVGLLSSLHIFGISYIFLLFPIARLMEEHQKSFGIAAPDGTLMPYFLTVLNLTPADTELTRHGWERVLRARLDDARVR